MAAELTALKQQNAELTARLDALEAGQSCPEGVWSQWMMAPGLLLFGLFLVKQRG